MFARQGPCRARLTRYRHPSILRTLDNLRPLPFDADEENEVGLGQLRNMSDTDDLT